MLPSVTNLGPASGGSAKGGSGGRRGRGDAPPSRLHTSLPGVDLQQRRSHALSPYFVVPFCAGLSIDELHPTIRKQGHLFTRAGRPLCPASRALANSPRLTRDARFLNSNWASPNTRGDIRATRKGEKSSHPHQEVQQHLIKFGLNPFSLPHADSSPARQNQAKRD